MTRTADLITAALLLIIGLIAIGDSLRLGAGWGSDGPRSGFFPFWLGTLLLAVTVAIAIQAWPPLSISASTCAGSGATAGSRWCWSPWAFPS